MGVTDVRGQDRLEVAALRRGAVGGDIGAVGQLGEDGRQLRRIALHVLAQPLTLDGRPCPARRRRGGSTGGGGDVRRAQARDRRAPADALPAPSMAAFAASVSLLTVLSSWALDWLWLVKTFWVMFWPRKTMEPHTMAKIIQPRAAPARTKVAHAGVCSPAGSEGAPAPTATAAACHRFPPRRWHGGGGGGMGGGHSGGAGAGVGDAVPVPAPVPETASVRAARVLGPVRGPVPRAGLPASPRRTASPWSPSEPTGRSTAGRRGPVRRVLRRPGGGGVVAVRAPIGDAPNGGRTERVLHSPAPPGSPSMPQAYSEVSIKK